MHTERNAGITAAAQDQDATVLLCVRLFYTISRPFEPVSTWRGVFEPSAVTGETERKRVCAGIKEPDADVKR